MSAHNKELSVDQRSAAASAASVLDCIAGIETTWQTLDLDATTEHLRVFQRRVQALTAAAQAENQIKVAELASILDLMLAPVLAGEERFTQEFKAIAATYVEAACELGRQQSSPHALQPDQEPVGGAVSEVFLLEPDPQLAHELQQQIGHYGYGIRSADDFAGLLSMLAERRPHAIIIDNSPEQDICLTAEHIAELRRRAGQRVPLIYLGGRDDVEARLLAARAGADAYLVKPPDLHELIDQLDRVGASSKREPYRIVVVEDSPTQAAYYSAILEQAGMIATVVSDPLQVLDAMNESAPDLVLMDMYMPHCNGMELAKVIRQVPHYASIPIVYLSAEDELERQLDALSLGGDDFLTKPINPAHLIRSVSIRAARARSLRSLMLTDNLTGLLNHSSIKEQLEIETTRAARHGSALSFAMLDIDHFKTVNDTHGHHVGDRVIKSVARVLQQRLRQTDYIGRYGGEEFAIILPDADLDEAVARLDELRAAFAKIRQPAAGQTLSVTFSGGVAAFPASPNATQLALDADKALYAAKNSGRNRIVGYTAELG